MLGELQMVRRIVGGVQNNQGMIRFIVIQWRFCFAIWLEAIAIWLEAIATSNSKELCFFLNI